MNPRERPIEWEFCKTGPSRFKALVDGQRWEIRLNDFPAEPYIFTLVIDGRAVDDFNDWPATWTHPPLPPIPA